MVRINGREDQERRRREYLCDTGRIELHLTAARWRVFIGAAPLERRRMLMVRPIENDRTALLLELGARGRDEDDR